MFSASTDSSHKARSLGQSFDSPRGAARRSGRRADKGAEDDHHGEFDDSSLEDFSWQETNP